MNTIKEQDLIKLTALLEHTQEFIAYFELADTKMMHWKQCIEQQTQNHNQRVQQQIQNMHFELSAFREAVTELNHHLAALDANEFQQITKAYCSQLEKISTITLAKHTKRFNILQLRTISIALITTLLSTLTIGFYLNHELPGTTKPKIMSKQEADKILILACPRLTQQQKNKILHEAVDNNRS